MVQSVKYLGIMLKNWGFIPGAGVIFLFSTINRLALAVTQFPVHWLQWPLSQRVKWPENVTGCPPPSSALKFTFAPLYVLMVWCLSTGPDLLHFGA